MNYTLLIKNGLKSSIVLSLLTGFLLLISCFPVFADESLISVTMSRNGNVSYVNIAPLHYEAKKKDFNLIQASPNSMQNRKPGELRPMELIIYSTCNRGDPQKESVLGFRAQFLLVSFLLSPHPDDLPATHYLLPLGWFRMLKEAIRGHPYFYEEGIIRIAGVHNKLWDVTIKRSDVTAVNSKTDYFINFVNDADQPLFIEALKSAAKPPQNSNIPQITLFLESPSLYVNSTYALTYRGSRNYQPIKSINILKWWSKQQAWCPQI